MVNTYLMLVESEMEQCFVIKIFLWCLFSYINKSFIISLLDVLTGIELNFPGKNLSCINKLNFSDKVFGMILQLIKMLGHENMFEWQSIMYLYQVLQLATWYVNIATGPLTNVDPNGRFLRKAQKLRWFPSTCQISYRKLWFFFSPTATVCMYLFSYSPSSDLFLAINASSISGFGSFGSFDDEFCEDWLWLCTWLCDDDDVDDVDDDISIVDGAIWWFWNGCIIDSADVMCKWETWVVIPLFNADDTQTDINWYTLYLFYFNYGYNLFIIFLCLNPGIFW